MSRFLENGLKSVNPRGYQGGQEWLWWALTHREGFWDIVFEPRGQIRSCFLVAGDRLTEASLRFSGLVGVEDATQVPGDIRPHRHLRHVCHGVLNRVKLAPLPRHASQHRLTGGLEAGMIVTCDQLDAPHITILEAL